MQIPAFVQRIVDEKRECYFISPHLDDAVLSAGSLLHFLSKKTKTTVISVFTQASNGPYTLSAKSFIKQCGYPTPNALFAARRAEDIAVCRAIGVEVIDLGFPDGLFRTKKQLHPLAKTLGRFIPELLHIYPIYKLHMMTGKVARADASTGKEIAQKLLTHVKTPEKAVIFCPVGAGGHVDHILTRDVCLQTFKQTVLWNDLPYAFATPIDESFLSQQQRQAVQWETDRAEKEKFVSSYKTQVKAMFGAGEIPELQESYFV